MVMAVCAALFFVTACTVSTTSSENADTGLTMEDLAGAWDITVVRGEIMPVESQDHKAPFIVFNLQDQRIHGNSGCNTMNGSYSQKEGQGNSLMLGQLMSTMMACPDMGVERKILDALHEVASFQKADDDEMALFDEKEEEIVRLKRKVAE